MTKTKRSIRAIAFVIFLFLAITTPVLAQTYLFSLDKEIVHVIWENDGSLSLAYEFVFTNSTSADPIDFVDVGMPNSSYSTSNASADVNGIPINHIQHSAYVSNGIELGLGSNAIQPGQIDHF